MAVTERVMGARHGRIRLVVVEQTERLLDNLVVIRTDKARGAGFNAFGRSVVSRITRTGFPKVGASSWTPPESVNTKCDSDSKLTKSVYSCGDISTTRG